MTDRSIERALQRVTGALANREDRPSQLRMAEAVAAAIKTQRHLIVQAGTGTGKTLGYLVPALTLGTRCVVVTATKALQDQLATNDLPLTAASLSAPLDFAVLKGRSNYLCRQRVKEIRDGGDQLSLEDSDPVSVGPLGREIRRLAAWAETAEVGDRADLDWEPSAPAWAQVSVGPRDCPGAAQCPSGSVCFAEAARRRAGGADVVVVNTHLYTTHLASRGEVLPPHDLVVFDEAHELEDIASATLGFELAPGRLQALARAGRVLSDDPAPATAVEDAAGLLAEVIGPLRGTRLPHPLTDELAQRLGVVRERVAVLLGAVRRGEGTDRSLEPGVARLTQAATHLLAEVDELLALDDSKVAWVEGPLHGPVLRVAPVDVGEVLRARLWDLEDAPTAVLTSATIPPRLAQRIGLRSGSFDEVDVGSPFDYQRQALLYCALHMPDPRHRGHDAAVVEELTALIDAAGGRTLALFTSWRAMTAAAEAVRRRVDWPVLTQSDLPKPALLARFGAEEHSCLFATMGFWQGVDVPGPALSVVAIDKLPFPRPDDPLLQARRDRIGTRAFEEIDLPRAATLLAQGAGRLIRSAADRGVVAVLDPRLGTARYRWALVGALPPMRRTRHRAEVEEFLAPLRHPVQ
ncbi:MAG: ATP-dependent DNA helicase [Acidimicrobiales bacterium]